MASTIAAITTGIGGVVTTADATGNLSLLSGTSTVVAVTSAGAAVTGTMSVSGATTLTGGLNTPLAVTSGGTGVATSTGSGANVLGTSPTLVTPILGTPTSGVATNLTGLPLTTGVTGTLPEANGGTGTTVGYCGFKNRIINGGMVIDQRNAGASVTPTNGSYGLDRWSFNATAASKFTAQQNAGAATPPAGFANYLGVTSSSAYSVLSSDIFSIFQVIEGFNTADLAWGTASAATVTISFWVRSSLTGTFGGALRNSAANRAYPFTYSISAANTWEQKTVTIAGDTSGTWLTTNGTGIILSFGLGGGSTYSGTAGAWSGAGNYITATGATSVVGTNGATFYITGVQLEKGSTATSFDYRPYGTELALCQRYYEILTIPASTAALAAGQNTASYFTATWQLKQTKRAVPTYTVGVGGYSGATPSSYPQIDIVYLSASTTFYINGTSGNIGASASAEL